MRPAIRLTGGAHRFGHLSESAGLPPQPMSVPRGIERLASLLTVFLALAAIPAGSALRADPSGPSVLFDIPAGPAAECLSRFCQQSGEQILYASAAIQGVGVRAVTGRHTAREALALMLAGTGLEAIEDPVTGALAIRRAPAPGAGSDRVAAAPGGVIDLPRFTISSTSADRYRPSDEISATRIRASVQDLPLSVDVVTRELMDDVGADSLLDATRYFPGVSNGRGSGASGIYDRQDFRGFESFGKTIDGFSTFLIPGNLGVQGNLEPNFVERIEVVKGPDSILAPTGTPGGSIDVITKSPRFQPGGEVEVETGTADAGKVTVDSTGPIGPGDRWAYRVIADYQDGRTYVPGDIRQSNLSAQLTWKPTESSRLTVKTFASQWELTGAVANPNDNGWYETDPGSVGGATIGKTPDAGSGFSYDGWNGDTTWSHRIDRTEMTTAEFTTVLGSAVSMRLAAMALLDSFHQDAGYPSSPGPVGIYDPATGEEVGLGPFNPVFVPAIANRVSIDNRDEEVHNDFAAHFQSGPVSLQPLAGWSAQEGATPESRDETAPLPEVDLLSPVFYDPRHPAASAYTVAAESTAHAWQYQGYALIRLGIWQDRLQLTSGISQLWTEDTTYSGGSAAPTLRGARDTYLEGIVVKPESWLSVYGTASSNASIGSGTGVTPVWQTGTQQELGAKAVDPGGRLSLSTAYFWVSESNFATQNPLYNLDPAAYPSEVLSREANHGVEIEAVGGLTSRLSLVLSYTGMRLRDAYGRRLRNIPDETASALLDYRFAGGALDRLSLVCGVEHNGDVAGETVTGFTPLGVPEKPGFYLPSWTVLNLGAGYPWRRFRFNVNVDNALDSRFPWQPAGRNSVSPYPGLAVRVRTAYRF